MKTSVIYPTLFFVLFLSICTSSQAQNQTLSLEQAIKLTKENSEELKMRLIAIEKTENQYREALGSVLPQLSANATWQKYFQNPVFFSNTFPINQQLQSSITISQTLWAFGKFRGALNAADAGKKMGQHQKEMAENEITYITKIAYYNVLLAQKQLKVAQQALKNAKDNLNIMERKFSGGRAPQGDYLRLKSDILARIPQLKLAETNYEHAQLTLAQLIGQEGEKFNLITNFNERFNELPQKKLVESLRKNQPQLKMLKESIHYSQEVSKVQKANNLPTLGAFGTYAYAGGSTGGLTEDNLDGYSYAGLSLTWNIWDGGSNSARYRQAVNDTTMAELKLIQQRKSLNLDLMKKITSYNNLITSYQSAKDAVNLAEKSFKISQRRFSTGQTSVTEINSSESALTQARLALTNNIFQIHATLSEINKLAATEKGQNL